MTAARNFACPRCEKTFEIPGFVMNGAGRLVAQCPNPDCLYTDPKLTPMDFSTAVVASRNDGAEPGWGGRAVTVVDPPVADTEVSSPSPAPARKGVPKVSAMPRLDRPAAATAPAAMVAPQSPESLPAPTAVGVDLVTWIEQRCSWLTIEEARLEGEIATARAHLAGARAERKRLEKMGKVGRVETPVAHALSNGTPVIPAVTFRN